MYIYGYLKLKKGISLQEEENLAFNIMGKAINNTIGMKFGGNAQYAVKQIQKFSIPERQRFFVFEIMETLLDIDADTLLVGDGVQYGDLDYQNMKSLSLRLGLIKTMLSQMLEVSDTEHIFLTIDGGFEEDKEIYHIQVEQFVPFILKQYKGNNNMCPSIFLEIKKE